MKFVVSVYNNTNSILFQADWLLPMLCVCERERDCPLKSHHHIALTVISKVTPPLPRDTGEQTPVKLHTNTHTPANRFCLPDYKASELETAAQPVKTASGTM